MLDKTLTISGVGEITIEIMMKSILARRVLCNSICLSILTVWDRIVSSIDEADGKESKAREGQRRGQS